MNSSYRGRIAPSPTGYLHLGHARTFWFAMERARLANGTLIYREEDLDFHRCTSAYSDAARQDLAWFGCEWQEGPDQKGDFAPYKQSERMPLYLDAWQRLKAMELIYPCEKSRKTIREATANQQNADLEPIYPENWRPPLDVAKNIDQPEGYNWRFRVPAHKKIAFDDACLGPCQFISGQDFGDFLIWRKDGIPSYELAVVVDDNAMQISEVVRGEDLLISTARQLLLYQALEASAPKFYHAPLVVDAAGLRLSKSNRSMALRELKAAGYSPQDLRNSEAWWSGSEDLR